MGVAACARPFPSPAEAAHAVRPIQSFERATVASRPKRAPREDRGARLFATTESSILAAARGAAESPLDQLLRTGEAATNAACPPEMASIGDRFCVDRFEASLVEVLPNGEERPVSPYETVDGRIVRAVSARGVIPQGYVSGHEAARACARSGKRLCKPVEWRQACTGSSGKGWGYGEQRERGRCNDHGRSAMGVLYGPGRDGDPTYWNMTKMNNPELNQLAGTVSKTGEHEACTNDYGVYDMVGNLHEWVDDRGGGFEGGYYLDVTQNGDGFNYKTKAHENWYHDYSTGFRCCADVTL